MKTLSIAISLTTILYVKIMAVYCAQPQAASLLREFDSVKFERLSIEEGLSQSVVTAIVQDHNGFLWFGTQDGLNKYDGYGFTVYKHSSVNSNSLSGSYIRELYVDDSKSLWIGIQGGGLNRFDLLTETFTHYQNDPENPNSLGDDNIWTFQVDSAGNFWIATEGGGLTKFNPESEQFTRYRHDPNDPNSLNNDYVRSLCLDRSGTIWVGTEAGLNNLNSTQPASDTASVKFVHYQHEPGVPSSLSHNSVWAIYEDNAENLWIGTFGGGLNKFDRQSGKFTHFKHNPGDPHSLSGNQLWSIYEDQSKNLLLGTYTGGLNIFDRQNKKFIHLKHDRYDPTSLGSDSPYRFYEDNVGRLWIGTFGGGVSKYDSRQRKFTHIMNNPDDPHSLNHNEVLSFYEDRFDRLWVGTAGWLSSYSPDTKQFSHYKHEPENPNSLGHNVVHAIAEDRVGNLWLATWGGGLNKLAQTPNANKQATFVRYKHDPTNHNSLSDNFIMSMHIGSSGDLWIGTTSAGLDKFDIEKEEFTHYQNDPENPNSISHNLVMAVHEGHSGGIWVGTLGGGLNKLDQQTGEFTRYQHNENKPASISNDKITSIYVDETGNVWVGTWGGGLNKLDRETNEFKHYFEEDGLANNSIVGILEDEDGNLWLSTNKGLSKFNIESEKFRNYDVKDGLQSNEFNNHAYYKSRKGELFFGGINGFNRFYPEQVKNNPLAPPIFLTAFRTFGESARLDTAASEIKQLKLPYSENYFSFEFSALDYTIPEKNQYAYKMEGFDKDWIYSGGRRFASYTNLDPGVYTFRVKGSNNDGVWNEEGTAIAITILPPWWRTKWAYALYVLLFSLTFHALRRFELNRVKMRNDLKMKAFEAQKLQEVDRIKSRFFANISHEFRTPLTLILGPLQDMLAKEKDKGVEDNLSMMRRNANRLLQLINQVLDLSRLESGKMTLCARRGDFITFLKGIVMSFASLAEQKQITLKFEPCESRIGRDSQGWPEVYFDHDKVEKIFYNLLSNAFKFTESEGKIIVSADLLQENGPSQFIEIKVKDTGCGIPAGQVHYVFDRFYQSDSIAKPEHQGTGIGLALTKELVELHHGTISVQSRENQGTTFTVKMPVGKEHLKQDEIVETPVSKESEPEMKSIIDISGSEKSEPLSREPQPEPIESDDARIVLIVEDHPDVRHYIRGHLQNEYHVIEAENGEDGLAKAIDVIPDLVISDVMMPKMDGYQFCESLKTNEKTSHIPVILLTAKAGEKDKREGLETGADDYLTKPFNSQDLHIRIDNLIEQRRKLRERFVREGMLRPREVAVTSTDDTFLNKLMTTIEENLGHEDFGVIQLSKKMYMNRRQINRKISALTGQTPTDFIRSIRLQRAKQLLDQNAGTVSEIAFEVGFGSLSYFAKAFKEQFGILPSEYTKTN